MREQRELYPTREMVLGQRHVVYEFFLDLESLEELGTYTPCEVHDISLRIRDADHGCNQDEKRKIHGFISDASITSLQIAA